MTNSEAFGFTTEQVHGGFVPDTGYGPRVSAIHMSSGFLFDDFDQANERFTGVDDGYTYTRLGNPTNAEVERRVALLEGGQEAILVGSGQAAATISFLSIVGAGDHIVSARSVYEGTKGLMQQNFGLLGIEVDFVDDSSDLEEWARKIRPNTKMLFGESIPNPKNDIIDIAALADIAHRNGIPLVIDNTIATPYLVRPLEHGADIVIHSASKFFSGHGVAIGGVVVDGGTFDWGAEPERWPHLNLPERALGGESWVERFGNRAYVVFARDIITARIGPTPSPFNAFLIRQGIETLSLRMERHVRNAQAIAEWLDQRPEVTSVDYAGLASSPYHHLATRYLPRGAGSVFAFTLAGGAAAARAFIDSVQLFSRMTHLGDVRSLILHPASTTHAGRTFEERQAAGIWEGLIRISVGIEDLPDLLRDLERGFQAVADLEAAGTSATDLTSDAVIAADVAELEHLVPERHVISEEI
jgi:O-acetylhomoserine (thiol)-lyase